MAKVIAERTRLAGRAWDQPKGYRRRLHRYGEDGPPRREGIRARWQGRTRPADQHVAPLRRYLDRQVGKPWDEVFSEVCARSDRRSQARNRVRSLLADHVATHVILIDGVPCDGEGGWTYGKPLHRLRYRPWYVCPLTGLLHRVKRASRRRRWGPKPERPPERIPVGTSRECRWIDGGWHLVTLKPLPYAHHRGCCGDRDVLLNRPVAEITPQQACRHYGAAVYAAAGRRLARRELRQFPIPRRWWGDALGP